MIAFLLYQLLNKGAQFRDDVAGKIAALWLKMFPLPGNIEVTGNVQFPGNLKVPLQQLWKAGAVRHTPEPDFAVYVNYAGYLWKLAPQVYGNWPATRVS